MFRLFVPVCLCSSTGPWPLSASAANPTQTYTGEVSDINFHWVNKRLPAGWEIVILVNGLSLAEGDTQVPDRQADGADRIPSASLGSRHYRRHYRDRRGELNYTWGVTAPLMSRTQ